MALKLIADIPISESLEYLVEEKSKDSPSNLYVKGPYLLAGEWNKNRRKYRVHEMVNEVERYKREMIAEKRALGELEHPASANINTERACHLVLELNQDGNSFIGRSKILSSPMGLLVRSLIMDGVKLGMSSRSLGKLNPLVEGHEVENMRLITIDCVADPSYPKAFVNGILESKQYVVKADGTLEESYDVFEEAVSHLPRKNVDDYLRNKVMEFIRSLK